jgi:hypothetical protein
LALMSPSSGLLDASEAVELATVTFRWPTGGSISHEGTIRLFRRLPWRGVVDETGRGDRRPDAPSDDLGDFEVTHLVADGDPKAITNADGMGGLDRSAIDLDMTGAAGSCRERAGLIDTDRPKQAVYAGRLHAEIFSRLQGLRRRGRRLHGLASASDLPLRLQRGQSGH